LQASTATIYAHRYNGPNDELTGVPGGSEPDAPSTWRFSVEVAKAWEAAAGEFELPHTRTVLLRSAMTMSPDPGGVFDVLLGLVRRGLGGRAGDGRQFVSWVHDRDFVRAVGWLVDHDLSGPVNVAAPYPVPNAEFMGTLRDAWGIRCGLPASRWMLEMGAFALRTETELVLKSRRVVPGRLLASGFAFEFSHWAGAAADLCRRWREHRRVPDHRGGRGRHLRDLPHHPPELAGLRHVTGRSQVPAGRVKWHPNPRPATANSTGRPIP
jgi:NAD dependent epimerase/dehydratase family enzyme